MNNFYNPYNPYTMQNYSSLLQNQTYQSPYTPQQNQYFFVNGLEGAKAYQIQPNQTVMLLDSEKPIICKKTSDQYGKSSIQFFKMVETTEEEIKAMNNPVPTVDYASKDDLNALSKKIDDIYKALELKEE